MSDLLNFNDDVDIFADTKHGDAMEANKELDALFEVNAGHVTNDTLDDILKPAVNEDIFSTKPTKLKKKQKSIRKKPTIFGADDFDPFASPKAKIDNGVNVPPLVESGAKGSTAAGNSDDSLDFLLDSQPLGTVLSSDDLLSLDPLSTPVVRPEKKPKDKYQEGEETSGVSKPSEDLFDVTTDDRKESSTAGDVADVDELFSKSEKERIQPDSNTDEDIFSVTDIKDKKQEEGNLDNDIFTLSNSNDKEQPDTYDDLFDLDEGKFAPANDANQSAESEVDQADVTTGLSKKPFMGSADSLDALLLEQPEGTVAANDDDLMLPSLPLVADNTSTSTMTKDDKSQAETDKIGKQQETNVVDSTFTAQNDVDAQTPEIASDEELFPELKENETFQEDNCKVPSYDDLFDVDEGQSAPPNTNQSAESDLFDLNDEDASITNKLDKTGQTDDIFDQTDELLTANESKESNKDCMSNNIFDLIDDGPTGEVDQADVTTGLSKKPFMGSVDSLDALLLEQPEGTVAVNDDDIMLPSLPLVADNTSAGLITKDDKNQAETDKIGKQQEANVVDNASTAPNDTDAQTPEIASDEELFPELKEHETFQEDNCKVPSYDDLFDVDEGQSAPPNTNQSAESDLFDLNDEDASITNKLDKTGQKKDIFDKTDKLLTANDTEETIKDDMSNDIFDLIDDGPTGEVDQADVTAGLSKKPFMGSADSLDALLLDQPEGTVAANDDDLMLPSLPMVAGNTSAGMITKRDKNQSETDKNWIQQEANVVDVNFTTPNDVDAPTPQIAENDKKQSLTDKLPPAKKVTVLKDSPTEKSDPLEDNFAFADDDNDDYNDEVPNVKREREPEIADTGFKATVVDTVVTDTPVKGKQGKQKKRAMERSFEDLLNGLSDESEPELDEMILSDDNDNTNLEKPPKEQSILVSPDQGKKPSTAKTYNDFSTPARLPSTNGDMSVLTSTPNTESTKGSVPDVEVKLFTPDDDEEDLKSWEMVDQEGKVKPAADNNDDNLDDVVMRNRTTSNADSTDDRDIDLSAIEDTNHLDVNITKHKMSIGKKGSMALRRKQSRKSRRSVMAEGDDAIFQDSSAPKSTDLMNGDADTLDDKDSNKFDMSPPAKRPNPSMMVPLPGMMGKPPPQRISTRDPLEDDDEDLPKPAKRVSKPPPGAFKLPDILPGQSSKPFQEIHRKNTDSLSHTFEKPALKSAKPPAVKESEDKEPLFDKPALRKVEGRGRERSLSSEERDVMFEKPALRSTPKPREVTPEATSETETGVFSKPALRETPKKPIIDRKEPEGPPSEQPIARNLRSTNKPSISNKPSAEKHTFDKPKLRSTARTDSLDKPNEQDNSDSSTFYEKPVLRSTKPQNKDVPPLEDNESASHKFDKPALRNTGSRNLFNKKDSGNVGQFDKPALRKTPTPDREVKSPREPKGIFDKPSLRKTENTSNNSDTSGKSDYKSSFPETQLRKTTPPPKEVVPEKPSWLKDAAEKQSKALDVIQTKENTNNESKKELPSWLDKTPVLKSSRGQPLQDTSNGQSESVEDRKAAITPRSREPSLGSDYDPEKRKSSFSEFKTPQNNYVPSWMRQGKAPSTTGGSTFISPASSTPGSSEEVPQWKKELAQRRSSRKESSPMDTPKREVSSEPEWKKNIQLRKTRPGDTPAKDKQTVVEPEWKKAAEEKRARLRNSTVES